MNLLNFPILALFGPTLISKNGPIINKDESKTQIWRSWVECSPCYGTSAWETCEDNICMQSIDIEDIVSMSSKLMKDK